MVGSIVAEDNRAALEAAIEVFGSNVVVEQETKGEAAQTSSERMIGEQSAAVHAALVRSQMRRMTVAEVQMARALGVIPFPGGRHRGTVRRLHAESFKPAPEISDELSAVLKACVRVMASKLPPEVVEMAGGAR